MKRALLVLGVAGLLSAAVAWSGSQAPPSGFRFPEGSRNLVSRPQPNDESGSFQFAVVSDRTGGHRSRVFSRAVEQLNLLQPEFVLSVGDLIEGYTTDQAQLAKEWREFQQYVTRLQMPFFYVPGNHDLSNVAQEKLWKEKFGRRYYDFTYKGVLFLMLNSEDPPGKDEGRISAEQRAFVKKSLETNRDARWTLVFLHKPMWDSANAEKSGWLDVERLLGDRPHTVFAGHVHRYQKFVRNGHPYYQLATTGGGSKMRGTDHGEFDHIVWVTMKKDGPVLANVLLDGVLPEDLRAIETSEEAAPIYSRKPTQPARGKVLFDGQPVAGAEVVLQSLSKGPSADAVTGADGTFVLSTYMADDGAPAGEYAVTIVWRKPRYEASGKPGKNLLPARYAQKGTSPLKAIIKTGKNDLVFELEK
jgi:serine/threonine-protein phosphatase CPPED1